MESEGLVSNFRAVADPPQAEEANRSAMGAPNQACSLKAKEIPAQGALRQGVCGRHGGKEGRLTADLILSQAGPLRRERR